MATARVIISKKRRTTRCAIGYAPLKSCQAVQACTRIYPTCKRYNASCMASRMPVLVGPGASRSQHINWWLGAANYGNIRDDVTSGRAPRRATGDASDFAVFDRHEHSSILKGRHRPQSSPAARGQAVLHDWASIPIHNDSKRFIDASTEVWYRMEDEYLSLPDILADNHVSTRSL